VGVAICKNYLPSRDEGWTRWMFDQYRFPYASLRDAEAREGNLRAKYDAIIIPDQSVGALVNGLPGVGGRAGGAGDAGGEERITGVYPAEYAGGLGEAGRRTRAGRVCGPRHGAQSYPPPPCPLTTPPHTSA